MKRYLVLSIIAIGIMSFTLLPTMYLRKNGIESIKRFVPTAQVKKAKAPAKEPTCVYKTIFGEQPSDSFYMYKTPETAKNAMTKGLAWMTKAQNNDGGWGAGSHYNQEIRDPHAVQSDPATTAMVCMALLRCDNMYQGGAHYNQLQKGTEFLLAQVQNAPDASPNITNLSGTQPQIKLGAHIDVVLTSQYLTNLLDHVNNDVQLQQRIKNSIQKCVTKIQRNQDQSGKTNGAGWAGVLQSSFATNAVETAKSKGLSVDDAKLDQAKNYQKQNFDTQTGSIKTEEAAGVMLYSVSSSVRSSAKESKDATIAIDKAKKEGKLPATAQVTTENLKTIGFSNSDADKYNAAYQINKAAKDQAMREDVMTGFGNNGGEEYLSYLQTGESLVMGKDISWQQWYDNVSGKLLSAQTTDGSWQGHHCITSPVFCTATCLLMLSIQNDLDELAKL